MCYYAIDRFEGDFCVCQNLQTEQIENIPRQAVPKEAEEGDVLRKTEDGYAIDKEKTNEISADIAALSARLWQ